MVPSPAWALRHAWSRFAATRADAYSPWPHPRTTTSRGPRGRALPRRARRPHNVSGGHRVAEVERVLGPLGNRSDRRPRRGERKADALTSHLLGRKEGGNVDVELRLFSAAAPPWRLR